MTAIAWQRTILISERLAEAGTTSESTRLLFLTQDSHVKVFIVRHLYWTLSKYHGNDKQSVVALNF